LPLAAEVGKQHLIGLAGAIRSPSGDVRGGFVALRSRESELAAFNALQRTMLWAVALGVVLALCSRSCRPTRSRGRCASSQSRTRQVQEGDYSVDIVVKSRERNRYPVAGIQGIGRGSQAKAALVDYMMQASGGAATQRMDSVPTAVRAAGGDQLRPGATFAGRYRSRRSWVPAGWASSTAPSTASCKSPSQSRRSSGAMPAGRSHWIASSRNPAGTQNRAPQRRPHVDLASRTGCIT